MGRATGVLVVTTGLKVALKGAEGNVCPMVWTILVNGSGALPVSTALASMFSSGPVFSHTGRQGWYSFISFLQNSHLIKVIQSSGVNAVGIFFHSIANVSICNLQM